MGSNKKANRLINETSPYLLQHAYNPVDWYSWGEEALEKAKAENKMLLISVGYSACHWCHVMEHESFENEEVAELMNAYFVCIKVDREERPDIDQIYMNAVQLLTQQGGWPLNCFALPDGRPFYGGTYFKKTQWVNVLEQLNNEFQNNPTRVIEYANNLTKGVKESDLIIKSESEKKFSTEELDELGVIWKRNFDFIEGGTNRAPKFPLPNNYQFLMRYATLGYHRDIDEEVVRTLNKMAWGGIYDQIGGGFSRYSVDKYWKVPHFEKMLYDNAQLISLYSEAYTRYKAPLYKEVVYETVQFCLRELYAGDGVYYSALDADSEGVEGKYYVWTEEELGNLLGEDYEIIAGYYNVGEKGFWEEENNILLRNETNAEAAEKLGVSEKELMEKVAKAKKILFKEREKRIRPGLDDKSLTSWNALMFIGLCDAYLAFGDEMFLVEAKRTCAFLLKTQRREDGGVYHSYKLGERKINGYLEDYCFTIEGLIKLYECTFKEEYLKEAQVLVEYVQQNFHNQENDMFYFTSSLDEALIARKTEVTDNVIPSSNSSMANALFKLGTLLDREDWISQSRLMLNNVREQMVKYGSSFSNWANLYLNQVHPFYEVAIVGQSVVEKSKGFNRYYIPNKILLGSRNKSNLPLLQGKLSEQDTTFYVCVDKTCQLPTTELNEALSQIK